MGYRLPARTVRIKFDGTDYDGAEVLAVLNVPVGLYRQISQFGEKGDFDAVVGLLCQFITEWNLEDDDGPIPISPEGFDRISDVGFVVALMEGWEAAIRGEQTIAAPLDRKSNGGVTSTTSTPTTLPVGS